MSAMTEIDVAGVETRLLYRDPYSYCAHPHLVAAPGGDWLLVFNRAPRREGVILHPPQDPLYYNVMMRSADQGLTWSSPAVVPGYDWHGVECAGLTALRDGRILLNQWQFDWLPLAEAERRGGGFVGPERLMAGLAQSPELDQWSGAGKDMSPRARFPWARGGGGTYVHLSDDGGKTFPATRRIETAPFSGGYGMRGAVELPDGDLLLPLSDVPNYRSVFVVRSRDHGETWSKPHLVAEGAGHEFEEPAGLLLPNGRVILMLRDNISRIMHLTYSDDGGRSWSPARPTGIDDYPGYLVQLPDGRIACVAGRRQPKFGIRIHISTDGGMNWGEEMPVVVRDDLLNKDLGYPSAVLRQDGRLTVVYYAQDREGITGIHADTVQI